jgi:hypothetical protein
MRNKIKRSSFNKLSLTLGLGLMISIIPGCGSPAPSTSGLKHELNNPTNGDSAQMWQEVTNADLQEVIYPLYAMISGGENVSVLKSDSVVARRIQFWLDAFHAQLIKKYPSKMKDVVKPSAQVLVTRSPNAFVMPVPVCYDVKLIIDSSAELNSWNTVDAAAVSRTGEIGRPWSSETCVKKGEDVEFLTQYVKDFNALKNTCKLSLEERSGKTVLVAGESCRTESAFEGVAAANNVVLHPVAGIITVHSGLLTMMTEEEVVSVLAHELGHYYKVHVDHPYSSTYDYFYTLKQTSPNGKPVAEPGLASLGQKAQQAELPNAGYRLVPGQKFRTELFVPIMAMGAVISKKQDCSENNCNKACADFAAFSNSRDFRSAIGDFPFGALDEDGLTAYKSFEAKALACFEDVSIGDDKLKEGKSIEAKMVSYAITYDRTVASMFASTEVHGDVLTTLGSATKSLMTAETKLMEPLAEAARRALGYYTTEQEADELSVEWLAMIGMRPEATIDAEFALGDFVEKMRKAAWVKQSPVEFDMATCKRLYRNSWRDENGKYVIVPIGDYADPHHSSCFRAFNADREIDIHNLKPDTSVSLPAAPGGSWAKIQAEVNKIHNGVDGMIDFSEFLRGMITVVEPANDPGIDAAEFVKRNYSGCRFFGNQLPK